VSLRAAALVIVLAATAVPVELRLQPQTTFHFDIHKTTDVATNILGYVPVGIALGGLNPIRAIGLSALASALAEYSQIWMLHRDASVADFLANVLGAIIGLAIAFRLKIRSPAIPVNRWVASCAVILGCGVVFVVWLGSSAALNSRGVTIPGGLEAEWGFDGDGAHTAVDSSGQGHNGTFSNPPLHVSGVKGTAIKLDGVRDYINMGRSAAFRLVGSMTVTAWIYSTSYPKDDAAIVSSLGRIGGFQFDTTVDTGPRTIGFKLSDPCGNDMARYGRTPLRLETWYHVAGVFDAAARTMTVYLNGAPDDGALHGPVGSWQRSSRRPLLVGRSYLDGFDFSGILDDVRLYSRALTRSEIGAVMQGAQPAEEVRNPGAEQVFHGAEPQGACSWSSEFEDAKVPAAAAMLGAFMALACIGFYPTARPFSYLLVSYLSGLALLLVASSTLPPLNHWTFPMTSLAGGASVVFSRQRHRDN
jgi:VanZ family protein